jgi:hypothetical protein
MLCLKWKYFRLYIFLSPHREVGKYITFRRKSQLILTALILYGFNSWKRFYNVVLPIDIFDVAVTVYGIRRRLQRWVGVGYINSKFLLGSLEKFLVIEWFGLVYSNFIFYQDKENWTYSNKNDISQDQRNGARSRKEKWFTPLLLF